MWGMAGMMGFMMLFGLLLLVGVVLLIALGVWFLVRRPRPAALDDPALEILRQRYARGEITREEFEARRRDLEA
ncbi:MAG: hypothetical protein AUH81_16530 [Candidatus Rokubacteria bacterium 13_1_40CM_4_69_5]|nr:MAG: hypothetical protein AUH81_16530 [Candidatus Rokubacteria bacterium 13_1_40CM_4_69_5]